jgi:hypothetical protein
VEGGVKKMREERLFRPVAPEHRLASTVGISLWLLLLVVVVAGCTAGQKPAGATVPTGDVPIQIPAETQFYIDASSAALARELQIEQERIELESVTEPAAVDGIYVVKLLAEGKLYEYQGQNQEVRLISVSDSFSSK